ncbi:MAG TPA: tetratricopeptide repeat protein, partial [Candidatus Obscuribacterales bacterium]
GFSSGAAQEAIRQRQAGEHVDLARIAACGLVQGAFDAAGAVPGGKQAEREALRIYNSLNISPEPAKSVPAWGKTKPPGAGVPAESLSPPGTERSEDRFIACGEAHMRMIKSRDESVELQTLDITLPPELPTVAKFERLTNFSIRMESIERARVAEKWTRQPLAAHPAQTVTMQREPVRVYEISGHDCELMIPEEYAKKLEPVRRERIQIDEGGEPTPARQLGSEMDPQHLLRALPEDIVPVVDGLPNSKLVGRINVLGHRYPYDVPGEVTLGTARDRKINLYRPRNDSEMRSTTNHEWAHLLHQQRPDLLERYRAAVDVEDGLDATSYNARKYARTNERENWAVHLGEEMLDPAAARMLEFGRHAPLRISVLGRALKVSITEGPQAETSLFRKQFEARANFIEERFVPLGLKSLLKEIRGTREPGPAALEMLGYLGNDSHIKYVKPLAGKAESYESARSIVKCGLELLKGRPEAQFKFLWDLAERDYSEPGYPASRAALSSFSAEQIDQYYKPALQKLERVLGSRNSVVAKRYLDLADWCRLHERPEEGEPLARQSLATYEEIYGAEHGKTGSAAFVLADCLQLQGKHEESLPYWVQSMEVDVAEFGQHHKSVFRHLCQIADIYERLGRMDDQESCLQRILAYYERTHGSDPAEAHWVLDKLSGIYARRQDYERAQDYERRAEAASRAFGQGSGLETIGWGVE